MIRTLLILVALTFAGCQSKTPATPVSLPDAAAAKIVDAAPAPALDASVSVPDGAIAPSMDVDVETDGVEVAPALQSPSLNGTKVAPVMEGPVVTPKTPIVTADSNKPV